MNENINLREILKGCEGIKLWSPIFGEVILNKILQYSDYCIETECKGQKHSCVFTSDGKYYDGYENSECILFPSSVQRDWSKFEKPNEFPKTYEEARSGFNENVLKCINEELEDLFKLIVIRDAWWTADNHWRPVWDNDSCKFAITCHEGYISSDININYNKILSFRTPELRDMFLKTHRDLIEKCKNYL